MTWLERIVGAYESLGGEADYPALYKELGRAMGSHLTTTQEATVRKEIERKSSDSDNFDGTDDLFYSVSLGSGRWGLRIHKK